LNEWKSSKLGSQGFPPTAQQRVFEKFIQLVAVFLSIPESAFTTDQLKI
jgi:hypothetical protein